MSIDLEDAIPRALAASGTELLSPTTDLAAGAKRGHRRRIAVRSVVSLSAIALITVGTTLFATGGGHHHTPADAPVPSVEIAQLPLVNAVWPEAIRTLPERLPGGAQYSVVAEVTHGVYVVQTPADTPHGGGIYRFTPATGSLVVLVSAPSLTLQPAQMVDNDTYLAVATKAPAEHATDVYVVSAGSAHLITHLRLPAVDPVPAAFGWLDGRIAWSAWSGTSDSDLSSDMSPGIYGPDNLGKPIPGAEAYSINPGTAPWATSTVVKRNSDGLGEVTGFDMWNLQTGRKQRLDATKEGAANVALYCDSTGCKFPRDTPFADGLITINGVNSDQGEATTSGHFAVVISLASGQPGVASVLDMDTDTYANLPGAVGKPLTLADLANISRHSDIVNLPDSAGHKVILNLAAITD